jgi:hypothetical protein
VGYVTNPHLALFMPITTFTCRETLWSTLTAVFPSELRSTQCFQVAGGSVRIRYTVNYFTPAFQMRYMTINKRACLKEAH